FVVKPGKGLVDVAHDVASDQLGIGDRVDHRRVGDYVGTKFRGRRRACGRGRKGKRGHCPPEPFHLSLLLVSGFGSVRLLPAALSGAFPGAKSAARMNAASSPV